MLLTRPYSLVSEAPKKSPALKPPLKGDSAAHGRRNEQQPPEAPMNQPPFDSQIWMLPESAYPADDDMPAPVNATNATSAARSFPDDNRMGECLP